jgi:hypothetical protein
MAKLVEKLLAVLGNAATTSSRARRCSLEGDVSEAGPKNLVEAIVWTQ